jgi:hypothetical protein
VSASSGKDFAEYLKSRPFGNLDSQLTKTVRSSNRAAASFTSSGWIIDYWEAVQKQARGKLACIGKS